MKVTEDGIDSLFQQFSIQEIQDIEKKLRNDIEKKKEDLRQMVGERYQDLINAADTITEMKNSTECITKHIVSMEYGCSNIYKEMGPSGILQTCTLKCSQKKSSTGPVFALASQLKLLMDAPTLLWWSLDRGQYLKASQVLRLAEHVYLSLSLDKEGHFQTVPLATSFPILAHQMTAIWKFRKYILQRTRSELKEGYITKEALVDIVCSILLLGDTSLESIFQEFLLIRMGAFEDIRNSSVEGSTIRDQICELVSLITNTISLVDSVFLLKEKSDKLSLLQETFQSISSQENPGAIKYFNLEASPTYSHLPQYITDFHPTLDSKCTTLDKDICYQSSKQWITKIKDTVQSILVNLLRYVTSVKGLSAISDSVDKLMQEPQNISWNELSHNVIQQDFPVYNKLLQTVLVDRIKTLCKDRIGSYYHDCQKNLLRTLASLRNSNREGQDIESDLSQYLWVESADDIQNLPLGTYSVYPEPSLSSGSLAMKASSFTPHVQSLCSDLDKSVGDLLEDIKHFGGLAEEPDNKHNAEMADLRAFIRVVLVQEIQKIMQTVQDIVKKNDECDIKTCYPFLSRFGRGLTDLCPNVKSCFSEKPPLAAKQENKWEQLKSEIHLISDEAFRRWGLHFTSRHLHCVDKGLKNINPPSFLHNTLEWDEIEIDEETEDGKPVKSVIRVPMQASMFLTSALFNICREINTRIGHVLPRSICQELRVEALQSCLLSFESCLPALSRLASDSPRFAQTVALQFIFDVQYLTGFFATKEQAHLLEQANKLVISLEELVDPFDLDVFHPHLQTNLALALQRSTLLLGLLCQERSVSTQRLASSRNQTFNLLPTTVGVGRFMTLPVSTSKTEEHPELKIATKPETIPKLVRGFGSSPSLQSSGSSDTETTNVAKSYSFFSAMGASWFGSSNTSSS